MSSAVMIPLRCFTASHVKRSGLCKCGNEARPGQGNCLRCNAEASRKFRKRQAEKKAAHRRQLLSAMGAWARDGIVEESSNRSERTGTAT